MIDLELLRQSLSDEDAADIREVLISATQQVLENTNHGDLERWTKVLRQLPRRVVQLKNFASSPIQVGEKSDLNEIERIQLKSALLQLSPWRKGPLSFFGITIDTEWRSDLKWDRLANDIRPLKNRRVLDIGCGNAYHCWRMKSAGARIVIGIDPNLLFACQFAAFQKYAKNPDVHMLPIGMEALPEKSYFFDTVFSMGVLYHRKSPIDYLKTLYNQLRTGGELVLETLVVSGDENTVLLPAERYARMRNVWFIPSSAALTIWLQRCGFNNIRLIDESETTVDEQRSTEWMQYESLQQSLDPDNIKQTVEELPAPKRAVFIATRN